MEPDELSLLDAEEEDENGFFSTTPTLSSQESLIDSLLSSSIKQSAQYTPVRRSALSKSTSGQDTFSKIKRLKRTSSVKNNNNNLVVPIQPALRSSYDGLPDTINYFEDEFKFPSLENPTYRINFESTDESNSEVELGMTDIDSDFLRFYFHSLFTIFILRTFLPHLLKMFSSSIDILSNLIYFSSQYY